MGIIKVGTWGSFGNDEKTFSALENGHAHAVAQAIAYLAKKVLPEAIERDHRLHDEGAKPDKGFDRPNMIWVRTTGEDTP